MRSVGLWVLLFLAGQGQLNAAPVGLDSGLQLLKQQALELERDVLILEEQLEQPLVIYFSMEMEKRFRLESLDILLDGKPLKSLEYSGATLKALRKGGAQQVYRGAIEVGEHELIAYYRNNRDYQRGAKIRFHKKTKPTFIEIIIRQQPQSESRQQPELLIRQWDDF
jgi:hypothetical protein